jgi:ribosomal protein L40E
MKCIYTHDNIIVLHSVKNLLALNNIESFVKNEHTIPAGARHGISNIFHELWIVSDQDYEKASLIIETEVLNPSLLDSWVCSKCNEENDGSFEVCWKCQSVPAGT